MINKFKHILFISFFIFFLTGCVNTQDKVQEFLQTDSATQVRNDYKNIIDNLVIFKKKLDMRNPNSFDKNISFSMIRELNSSSNIYYKDINGKSITKYDEYFKYAFDKNPNIKNRNDYLILGMYKLIYEAYNLDKGHQLTTLTYNIESLRRLYYYLKALKWKIKNVKDNNNNYLFLTWQQNWQIELEKKLSKGEKPSWKMIQNLKYIKEKKESIYDSSNFSFEVILSQMIYDVKNSLKNIGEEPVDIGIEVMKSLVFFL